VILALLVWAICATAIAGYYLAQYNTYRNEYNNLLRQVNMSIRVNILVSYGNGTRTWFNNTLLSVGSTAFSAILAVSDVKYKDYGGTLGILVTSINGLASDSTTHGWFYWYRETGNSTWISPTDSCTQQILHQDDAIAFSYESFNPWPTSPS
jgi:sensor histidine kinase YesM